MTKKNISMFSIIKYGALLQKKKRLLKSIA